MAHVLDSFPEDGFHRGREKYPWDEWFDGQVWQLNRGIDFPSTPGEFRSQVYVAARRRDLMVRTAVLDGNILIIQAWKEQS